MSTTPSLASPLRPGAAVLTGLVAGLVFMMLEMVMVPVFQGGSPWAPPRMIAAMAMGREVLPPPASFDFGVLMVAMAIHMMLSVLLGLVFAFIARGRSRGTVVVLGLLFGLAVYVINFYGMTAVFPWFAQARNWISIATHAMFGLVLGAVYAARARPRALA